MNDGNVVPRHLPTVPPAQGGLRVTLQAAAAFAASMGIGRFIFTPILPLMEAQAGISPQVASMLATSNYLGYLIGALSGIALPMIGRARVSLRISGVVLVLSLLIMPLSHSTTVWVTARGIAGVSIAILFMVAANALIDNSHKLHSHHAGWAYGGIGAGIAASGILVAFASEWKSAWWISAAVTLAMVLLAWNLGSTAVTGAAAAPPPPQRAKGNPWFVLLTICYFLQGAGYIIAGTFLVAAVSTSGPSWLGNGVWTIVGLASIPSCVLWAWLAERYTRPTLMAIAMTLQAIGIAIPAFSDSSAAAILSALLFGSTFVAVVPLALATGRQLGVTRAIAILTTVNSVGQVLGPIVVTPLLVSGYRSSLVVGAALMLAAACVAALIRIRYPQPKK